MARQTSKLLTIPKLPDPKSRKSRNLGDSRFVAGQQLLAHAISYLAKTGPRANRDAISLLSEHFRTQFRMSDRP
ncbi:MAG: hypothetical protein HYX26_09105 [Acidobacteriales bacterium]|nr:hypothetical protein [Terriglobales bacterium]